MNTEGCGPVAFTDEILVMPGTGQVCGSTVAAWLTLAVIWIILRWAVFFLLLSESRKYASRLEKVKEARTIGMFKYVGGMRIPYSLLVSFGGNCCITLFVILASANVINSRNGASFLVFGIICWFLSTGQLLQVRRLIELGRKIIPLSQKKLEHAQGTESLASLSKLNLKLQLLSAITILSALACAAFNIVCLSPSNKLWAFETSMFSCSVYELSVLLLAYHQFSRCMEAILKLSFSLQASSDPVGPSGDVSTATNSVPVPKIPGVKHDGVKRALVTMRFRQLLIVGVTSPMLTMTILIAVYVVPFYYWLFIFLYGYLDSFLSLGILLAPRILSKKPSPTKQVVVSGQPAAEGGVSIIQSSASPSSMMAPKQD